MIKKKICMLGAFAVGKTSLVQRFVKSIFSEKYLTTVGVKIDKKTVNVGEQVVDLMLWDIYGEDEFLEVRTSYLRGASGYFLVVDGTRSATLETARLLQKRATETIGNVPFLVLINKVDLTDQWEIEDSQIESLLANNWQVVETSAKTGEKVEEAFLMLTEKMLKK